MRPTPYLARKCDLAGCERQAHGTLSDGRVICDWHMLMFGLGAKKVEAFEEAEEKRNAPDLLEELEEGKYQPGDEKDGLKPER